MSRDERRPLPPYLDPRGGRAAVAHPPRARRSSRAAVVARSVAAVLSALVLLGSGWGWHLARVAEASLGRTDAIPDTGNSDVNGEDHAGEAMNLLLVGLDSRAGLTREQQEEFSTGDPEGVLNTDSMMLVHVPADGSAASFVSLPRDTYVSIPGFGKGRLNAAYSRGYGKAMESDDDPERAAAAGAQALIRTVNELTGLRIDHFAAINLLGFINLSNLVGGVEVNLCRATSDPKSGADFRAGVQIIEGDDALKFVRQRYGLPRVDLDRVVRQQVYLAGMLRNIVSSKVLFDLGTQKAIVEQVGSSLVVDNGLSVFDLAAQMQGVRPEDITFQTIPGLTDQRIDGADVLVPSSEEEVEEFFASLTAEPAAPPSSAAPSDAAPPVSPGDVSVTVLNGSGVSGVAAAAEVALEEAGFGDASSGNADPTARTTVRHHTGEAAAARLVAGQVPGAALAVDDAVPPGTVQLVIGADYNGIGQAVTPQTPAGGPASKGRTAADRSCIY